MVSRLSLAVFFLACSIVVLGQADISPNGASNGTFDITASVLSVRQLVFPVIRLTLRITESSNPQIVGVGKVITAENYIWTSGGKVDYSDSRNIGSLAGWYLLPGDQIRAKLLSGAVAGRQNSEWYVHSISRRGAIVPATPSAMPKVTSVYGKLLLALEADTENYQRGQPVNLTLTLTNTGDKELSYQFSSGQQYDIVIAGENNREVWRWSRGKAFIQAFTTIRLGPGESKVIKEVWRQTSSDGKPLSAGEYTVTAYLTLSTPTKPTVGPLTIRVN